MFFKNRSLVVKAVKDEDVSHIPPTDPIDYEKLARTITKGVVIIIAAYMGADTVRQVIIKTFDPTL